MKGGGQGESRSRRGGLDARKPPLAHLHRCALGRVLKPSRRPSSLRQTSGFPLHLAQALSGLECLSLETLKLSTVLQRPNNGRECPCRTLNRRKLISQSE